MKRVVLIEDITPNGTIFCKDLAYFANVFMLEDEQILCTLNEDNLLGQKTTLVFNDCGELIKVEDFSSGIECVKNKLIAFLEEKIKNSSKNPRIADYFNNYLIEINSGDEFKILEISRILEVR